MMVRRALHLLTAAAYLCFAGLPYSAAQDAAPVAKPGDTPLSAQVERVLSAKDVQLYRDIFALQERGDWSRADANIKRLSNKILMGHVQHQRMMHPTAYRARYREMKQWLATYSGHPGALRVYRLALKRRGKAAYPKRPAKVVRKGPYQETSQPVKDRKSDRAVRRAILNHIKYDRLTKAGEQLLQAAGKGQLSREDVGRLAEGLNRAWIKWGTPEKGLAVLRRAAPTARPIRITTDWEAGLAAWKLGDYTAAETHFSAVAGGKDYANLAAAGGVWAARAALRSGKADTVSRHLRGAYKRAPDSFYGLIAARQLGIEIVRDWSAPVYTSKTWPQLRRYNGVLRAVALSQVGQSGRADNEVLNAWYLAKAEDYKAFLGLAGALDLPQAQVRIAESVPKGETAPLLSLYPIPSWQPVDGFQADPAMLFALIRQESRFSDRARSRSGARGLMQMMPRTAGYIGKDRALVRDRENLLYDAAFNMSLGQRYVNYLKEHDATQGDLFYVLAAYNGGPGNVNKWRRTIATDDPLWFMEHIPLRETRAYVEQVAANYWIYRMAMGLETATLDHVATGRWPKLEADSQAELPQATLAKAALYSDTLYAN